MIKSLPLPILYRSMLSCVLICLLAACNPTVSEHEKSIDAKLPNVVVVYVDDLGYGDLGCYGAKGVSTPYVDEMAQKGIRFTDGHCTSATCTPSRYSLLAGEHAFRNKAKILPGDAPLIIDTNKSTLPKMFKRAGYATAVVGKWHLGLGDGNLDWNQDISPGPKEVGFDYSFLIPATGDRVPTVYVENQRVVGLNPDDPILIDYKKAIGDRPNGIDSPELRRVDADKQHSCTIVNGVSRIGYMSGGESALWVDEDFPDVLNEKAKKFINQHKEEPFFLFYSYHDIHVPRLPHPRFKGKSEMGPRGDAIVQMDWMTGQIVEELERLGIAENTLIIFTSDNGPVLNDGYEDEAIEKLGEHRPNGPFRGGKYSAFEAGTRVPTIAYWPGTIKPKESDALVSQVDLYASLAALIGQPLASTEAIDSKDYLSTWLGKSTENRDWLIEESYTLTLREDSLKYIRLIPNAGPNWLAHKGIEGGFERFAQLYDLSKDKGEQENIAEEMPGRVAAMEARLKKIEERIVRE